MTEQEFDKYCIGKTTNDLLAMYKNITGKDYELKGEIMAKDNLGYYMVYPYKREEQMAERFGEDDIADEESYIDYDDDGSSDYDSWGV